MHVFSWPLYRFKLQPTWSTLANLHRSNSLRKLQRYMLYLCAKFSCAMSMGNMQIWYIQRSLTQISSGISRFKDFQVMLLTRYILVQLIRSHYPHKERRLFDDVLGTDSLSMFVLTNNWLLRSRISLPLVSCKKQDLFSHKDFFIVFNKQRCLSFIIRSTGMLLLFQLYHVSLMERWCMIRVAPHLLLSFP